MTVLTPAQVADFRRDGFLVVPDFADAEAIAELRARANELEDQLRAEVPTGSEFSTTDQSHAEDRWFMESGGRVRGFFEQESHLLNKIGHAMHDLDPVFDRFVRNGSFESVAAAIGFVEPRLVQSMYIYKHPGVGGEVTWHTDHTFLWTEPRSVVGFWVAVDDADQENGCLWAIPGGHRLPVKSQFVRDGRGGAVMRTFDTEPYPIADAVPIEATSGTLVLLDGALPHWSDANRSAIPRQAFTLHVVDAAAEWSPQNWLQRDAALPFRGF